MYDFFFNSIWGWLGIGGTIIAAAGAVAYFFPPFRKLALTVAATTAGVLAIYAKGSSDARKRKQAEWDAAEKKAIDRGNKAHADAKRDVAAGRVRDKFDRDDL
jgi:hypothetical protein